MSCLLKTIKQYILLIIQSPVVSDHIKANLKHRGSNIKKFHDWLDINEDTPIVVKLTVLYNCMFSALTYGCEAWFGIDTVSDDILATERSLLKRILGVRKSTPNDLVYTELGFPNIKVLRKND